MQACNMGFHMRDFPHYTFVTISNERSGKSLPSISLVLHFVGITGLISSLKVLFLC